jgi:hypothetical protein
MGTDRGGTEPGAAGDPTARRDFLRKAAVVGTGAFAVPMIITVDPADAQALTSPPPKPPGSGGGSETAALVGSRGTQLAGRSQSPGRGELPRTGADIDRMIAAGLAATAGGAALMLWSADTQSRSAIPETADPEPDT